MPRAGKASTPSFRSFALRFLAGFGVVYALLYALPFSGVARDAYCRALAGITALALRGVGIHAQSDGAHVQMLPAGYRIVRECDGLVLLALFLPAVLALRFPSGREWWKLAGGAGLLVLLNWIRLFGYGLVSALAPDARPLTHDFVFQAVSIAALVALFLGWAAGAARPLDPPMTDRG